MKTYEVAADERTKPKRPLAITSRGHGVCPRCESLVSKYKHQRNNRIRTINQCKWCGQALDWERK